MKVLYVTTISNTINAFLIPHIKMLIKNGYQVDVASNLVNEIDEELIKIGCKVYDVKFSRNPLKLDNLGAYKKIKKIINNGNYEIVHTHTPVASACVRLACKTNKKIKVFYTAHGFHFYKGASLRNWVIYYPVEKYLSKYTDVLITINQEDYDRAKKSFKAKEVVYVPGVGLNVKEIQEQKVNKSELKSELGITDEAFVILSVGELNKNKNHKTIIKAIAKINDKNIYYIVCGVGAYRRQLEHLINELKLNENVKLLGYRKDISEILKIADLFVFPSYREGLPVSLMEAMASELPIVCSNIRGNSDLIKHEENGYLIKPDNVVEFKNSIETLYNNPPIREQFKEKNGELIKRFSRESVLKDMIDIYKNKI